MPRRRYRGAVSLSRHDGRSWNWRPCAWSVSARVAPGPPMTRRVLLASLNAGGGHHALRDSFAAALARVDPEQQRLHPVVWNSADRFIDWFYSMCVRFLPRFQGKVVELSGQPWALRTAMMFSPQLRTEASALLRAQIFDLWLTTH